MTIKTDKWLTTALIYFKKADLEKAEALCLKSAALQPKDVPTLSLLAKIYYAQKKYLQAIATFHEILEQVPAHQETLMGLTDCYKAEGDIERLIEIAHLLAANDKSPENAVVAYRSFLATCDWTNAKKLEPQVIALCEQNKIPIEYLAGVLLDLNTREGVNPVQIFAAHKNWGDQVIQLCKAANIPFKATPKPQNHIKIAYISGDFNQHPVGHMINPVITYHDRNQFEIYCYAHMSKEDALTEQFRKKADHFVDISHMSHAQTALRVNQDGIHILIDLAGHTRFSQLAVLGFKPAPIQITYLGYPNTTGLSTVDYRITDHHSEAEGGTIYSEKLLYMPETFITMPGFPEIERAAKTPAEDKGFITFGSFNDVRKLNPGAIKLWSEILLKTPASRILLKSRNCQSPLIRQNILNEFDRHQIGKERIKFGDFTKSYEEHAVQYNQVDIALDTFPYHGTQTTCEALWMGVPVITLEGKMHVQRVSSAILRNIGFEETIATNKEEYVAKAVNLASRPETLSLLRQCMHVFYSHSILCQPEKVTRHIEALYQEACRTANLIF